MINDVHCGDNLSFMESLQGNSVDLIYIDPPFNTGRNFKQYDDRWESMDAFLDFMRPRLEGCHRILKDTGSLYLHCDHRTNYKFREVLNKIFGEKNFINEIKWCYANGGASERCFSRKSDTIFLYSKTKNYTFNKPKEKRNSEILKRLKHKSTRIDKTKKDWDKRGMTDYWVDIQSLNNQAKEKTGYPTQKTVALLERIIKASSNEGDLVADFFCGSGTTLVAAKKLGRNYLGCDKNPEAVKITESRLQG